MAQGLFIPQLTQEELLQLIKSTVKEATKEAFDKLSTDKLLTQQEAVELLSVSKTTIIKWAKKGWITPKEIGGRVYYLKSDLLAIQTSH